MTWKIRVTERADKAFGKLDKPVAKRIIKELRKISQLDNPRSRGKSLSGNLAGLWRYRVGDYRIICDILDDELVILAIDIAHRREAYRR